MSYRAATRNSTTENAKTRKGENAKQSFRRDFAFSPFRVFAFSILIVSSPLLAGCTRDGQFQAISMWNESRLKPLEEAPRAGEQSSSRPLVPGAIARGELPPNEPISTGMREGRLVERIPISVTRAVLERGQGRFNIYCSPCHGRLGNGEGMIVKRGFPHPPDYKLKRLVNAPVGHFFDVMTNGYGVMYSYASRVPVKDRWAITAYLRVLQHIERPVIPESRWEAQRLRARAAGIGARPLRPTGP